LIVAAGCGDARLQPADSPTGPREDAALDFDPLTAGTITGQVTWTGDVPAVAPLTGWVNVLVEGSGGDKVVRANPHAPDVDPQTNGVRQAVVLLRGVDPRRAKPWDQPPVRVEQRDYRLHIRQGAVDSPHGFVRRGDPVEMVSTQSVFHSLHAGGAEFFTLAFPDPHQPRVRRLDKQGHVELTSAAGYFWMRAYLFVDEHPYYTRTDAEGRFALTQVPPGRYELVCWLPNWHLAHQERNADSGLVTRLRFHPPVELVQPVTLGKGETQALAFAVSTAAFPR
jgi:hypothetical protein